MLGGTLAFSAMVFVWAIISEGAEKDFSTLESAVNSREKRLEKKISKQDVKKTVPRGSNDSK